MFVAADQLDYIDYSIWVAIPQRRFLVSGLMGVF